MKIIKERPSLDRLLSPILLYSNGFRLSTEGFLLSFLVRETSLPPHSNAPSSNRRPR